MNINMPNKISLIKLVRNLTALGLKESKDLIEALLSSPEMEELVRANQSTIKGISELSIPEGWEIDRIGVAQAGEYYLEGNDAEYLYVESICPLVVLRKRFNPDGYKYTVSPMDVYKDGITIPNGYSVVDFRPAKSYETYLSDCNTVMTNGNPYPRFILKKD